MEDRLEEILENTQNHFQQVKQDIVWMGTQVGNLRGQIKKVKQKLAPIVGSSPDMPVDVLVDIIIHQHKGMATELNEIYVILVEGLGYQQAPTLEEDPDCPCPEEYVIGDHTAATLASEAANRLKAIPATEGNKETKDQTAINVLNAIKQFLERSDD
jgi:hypothetical protein